LLRTSKFDPFHYEELVQLSHTKFRFLAKGRPDDYAESLSVRMAWPVPRHLLLAARVLTSSWENEEDRKRGEEKIAEYLESFRVGNSRVILMAKAEDIIKLHDDLQWSKEPWYGTEYAVRRWDADFVKQVRVVHKSLSLPHYALLLG
jgi:insulysin